MFNRVGNLTVLSLRREINQLVDIISKDNTMNGATSIQAYLQMQSSVSSAQKTQSGGKQVTLVDELRKHLDLFSDYATLRIYWKFYKDKRLL